MPFSLGGASVALWSKSVGDVWYDSASDTAIDSAGNIVVTGSFGGTVDFGGGPLTAMGGSIDIFVAKFNSNGNPIWSKRFGDNAEQGTAAIAIDGADNVVVIGTYKGTVDFGGGPLPSAGALETAFVAKLDSSGNHVWSKSFAIAGYGVISATAIDSAGNVVITGRFEDTVDFGGGPVTSTIASIYVAKFDANGNHVWSKSFADLWDEGVAGIVVDSAGNVAITGFFYGSKDFGTVDFGGGPLPVTDSYDIYLAKFDPNGNHLWSKSFGEKEHETQIGYAIAVDSADNLVITGSFLGTVDFGGGPLTYGGGEDIFVAKFDPNGNHVFSRSAGDSDYQVGPAIAIDGADNVVMTGQFLGTVDWGGGQLTSAGASDIFVAKLDPNGDHLWSRRFGNASFQEAVGTAIDSAGNVVITGNFDCMAIGTGKPAPAGQTDVFLAKLMP